jgi:hypothetical protein
MPSEGSGTSQVGQARNVNRYPAGKHALHGAPGRAPPPVPLAKRPGAQSKTAHNRTAPIYVIVTATQPLRYGKLLF